MHLPIRLNLSDWRCVVAFDTMEGYPEGVSVVVKRDFEGYFEECLREAIWAKHKSGTPLKHKKFVITSGGYCGYDVSWKEDEEDAAILKVDFYSPLRFRGGPDMSNTELVAAL